MAITPLTPLLKFNLLSFTGPLVHVYMKIYEIPHCHHKHVAKQRFHGYSVSKLDNNWKVLIWHVEEVAFLLTASMIGTLELLQCAKMKQSHQHQIFTLVIYRSIALRN